MSPARPHTHASGRPNVRAAVPSLSAEKLREQPLLGRYRDALPLRVRDSFQLLSARRLRDDRPCVVLLPGGRADVAQVAAAFAEIERVHALLDHPRIPKVSARGEVDGTPFLELDCDAVLDGIDFLRLLADAGRKIPYAQADGFIVGLRLALQAAHARCDPRTGEPVCLGRMSLRNVLLSPSGQWFLVGFGRNFPLERESGALDGETVSFQAPEVGSGGRPSPIGDYIALLLMLRSGMSYVNLLEPLGRILRGDVRTSDAELVMRLTWTELRLFASPPSLRPGMEEAIATADRLRELLGVTPDFDGFASFAASLVASHVTTPPPEPPEPAFSPPVAPILWLGEEGEWFAGSDGVRQKVGRAGRKLLLALVEQHRTAPRACLSVWSLLDAGWPGEVPVPEAGANRVYVEISRLRARGLRDVIERSPDGYRLAPGTVVHVGK